MLSGPNPVLVISMILSTAQIVSGSDPVVHELNSKRQSAVTSVRMLLPDRFPGDDEPRLPVVYVLPVEAGEGMRWGNSLAEVQKHDLQNRHHVVCVFPTFADLPWYADHPMNPQLQ